MKVNQIIYTIYQHLYLKKGKDKQVKKEIEEIYRVHPEIKQIVEDIAKEDLSLSSTEYEDFKHTHRDRKSQALKKIQKVAVASKNKNMYRFLPYAAACLLVLTSATWIIKHYSTSSMPVALRTERVLGESIQPGGSRATLTLQDGQTIQLDSLQAGIAVDDGVHYADGKAVVDLNTSQNTLLTLRTPRGGEYKVTLSDGTVAHLNADSKLSYPTSFLDNTRLVSVSGEVYFDVAHDRERPFIIETPKGKIQVLGTSFNVRAYDDERKEQVTLVEGKVNVAYGANSHQLNPSQQSISDGQRGQVKTVDVEDFVSWKHGVFSFANEDLESVSRKISRWYDIDINVNGGAKDVVIWGSVSRYETFDKFLAILNLIDKDLKIKIDGRRVNMMK